MGKLYKLPLLRTGNNKLLSNIKNLQWYLLSITCDLILMFLFFKEVYSCLA